MHKLPNLLTHIGSLAWFEAHWNPSDRATEPMGRTADKFGMLLLHGDKFLLGTPCKLMQYACTTVRAQQQ